MAQEPQTCRSRANKGSNSQCLLCQWEAKATGKELELPGTQHRPCKRQATYSRAIQPQAMRLPTLQQTSCGLLADSLPGRDLLAEHPLAASLLGRGMLAESLLTRRLLRRNTLAEDLLAKSVAEELVGRDQPARDLLATSLPTTTPPVLQSQPVLLR